MSQGHRLTVGQVFVRLSRHPGRHLVRRWNWKTGLISFGWRGGIFFAANLSAGLGAGLNALLAEACYRPVMSGFLSALTQAFRFATPGWLATVVVAIWLPILSHLIEFAVHSLHGTQRLGASIAASVMFTVISSMVELFAMRRGILVVGGKTGSLLQDLRMVPRLWPEFLAFCSEMIRPLRPQICRLAALGGHVRGLIYRV